VSLILLSLGALIPFPEPASAYTPHAPILIIGDANFLPANGVTGGSGTWNDPYVIEGWDINASTAHGIEIRDSKRQFTCTGQVTILCLRRVDGHPCGDQVRLLHAPLDKQRQAVLAIA